MQPDPGTLEKSLAASAGGLLPRASTCQGAEFGASPGGLGRVQPSPIEATDVARWFELPVGCLAPSIIAVHWPWQELEP